MAEGHDCVARLIRDALLLAGYSVEIFRDGDEVLRTYRRGSYSLIIVDQRIPGTSGLELLAVLRDRGDRTPIILLAGRSRRMAWIQSQAVLYQVEVVRKPFAVSELRSAVQRVSLRRAPRHLLCDSRLICLHSFSE